MTLLPRDNDAHIIARCARLFDGGTQTVPDNCLGVILIAILDLPTFIYK